MNSLYPTNDHTLKKHVEVLEQNVKDSLKGLPKGYDKLTTQEEKIELLEGRLFKKLLNRRAFYKLTEK